MDLAEVRRNLQVESDELGTLSATLRVVYNDLEVVRSDGTSSLVARAVKITAWVCQLERNALRIGVNQSFHDCSFSLWGQHRSRGNEPWLRTWL